MAQPITSAGFPQALKPEIRKHFAVAYGEKTLNLEEFFGMDFRSDRDREIYQTYAGLGTMEEFTGRYNLLAPQEGYTVTATFKEYGNMVSIQEVMLADDQSGGLVKRLATNLGRAFRLRVVKTKYQWFNNMFLYDTTFRTSTEGIALCGTHTSPLSGQSSSTGRVNRSTSKLSRVSLSAARRTMRRFVDYTGEPLDMGPTQIVCGLELADKAAEITKTPKGLDTPGQNFNIEGGKWEVHTSVRINSTTNWATVIPMLMKDNLKWIWRQKLREKSTEEFQTNSMQYAAYTRFGYFWLDWCWILGHEVS